MTAIPIEYRISSWREDLKRDREFYRILLLLLLLGLLFMLLLANWKFAFKVPDADLRRYTRIQLGPTNIPKFDKIPKLGGKYRGKVKKGPKGGDQAGAKRKKLLNDSLVGVIGSQSKGAQSAVGRMFQKGGLGSQVDNVLRGIHKGKGTGGLGDSNQSGRKRGFGAGELSDGGGVVEGALKGVDTGYAGGDAEVDLGYKYTRQVTAQLTRGKASVEGTLDPSLIDRVVKNNLAGLKYCYEKELNLAPNLSGKVVVQFTIGLSGDVEEALIESSSLNHAQTEDCIVRRVRRWKFPRPQGDRVIVAYPFVFSKAK